MRTLVVLAAAAVGVGMTWWALAWATGMVPLQAGALYTTSAALSPVAHSQDAAATDPTVWRWSRDGRWELVLWLHNSASVPVTVTGVDHSAPDWVGAYTGPALGIPDARTPARFTAFHSERIPADGTRGVTFVFRGNSRACGHNDAGTTYSTSTVTIHYTTLGVFHNTETIALGESSLVMRAPTPADC